MSIMSKPTVTSAPKRMWVFRYKYTPVWVVEIGSARKLCRDCGRILVRYFRRFCRHAGLPVYPRRSYRTSGLVVAFNEWTFVDRTDELYCWKCSGPCFKVKYDGPDTDFLP